MRKFERIIQQAIFAESEEIQGEVVHLQIPLALTSSASLNRCEFTTERSNVIQRTNSPMRMLSRRFSTYPHKSSLHGIRLL